MIDMDEKGTESALRISPHYYNTTEEIDTCGGSASRAGVTLSYGSYAFPRSTGSSTFHTVSAITR